MKNLSRSGWMPRFLQLFGLLVTLIAGFAPRAGAADPDDGLVLLPPFQVADIRPWLYASAPGFEILSLEKEAETRRIVTEIQRAGRFMPWFFPAGAFSEPASKSVVFLDRFSPSRTIAEAAQRLKAYKIDVYVLNGLDGVVQFTSPEIVSAWASGRRSPSRLWFSNLATLVRPQLPQWYRTGVGDILNSAKVSDTKIESPGQAVDYASVLPLAELLAVKTQAQSIDLTNANPGWNERYHRAAVLLVRWGLFSDSGVRRSAFVNFAASTPNADNATFEKYFGLTAAEAELSLRAFAADAGRKTLTLALPKSPSPATLAPVNVRPATETEVARIVGNSYQALASQAGPNSPNRERYLSLARKNLSTSGVDRDDPRLNAILAIQESLERHPDEARPLLATARRAGLATPYLYYLEASLALQAIDRTAGGSLPLSASDRETVLPPLRAGMKLFPPRADHYRLMADVYAREEADVPPADLALLLAGSRANPDTLELVAKTALLHFHAGQLDVVDELVTRGLASPNIERTPHKATLVGLKQKLEENSAATVLIPKR